MSSFPVPFVEREQERLPKYELRKAVYYMCLPTKKQQAPHLEGVDCSALFLVGTLPLMWRVLPLQRTVPAPWEAIVPIGLWGEDTLHTGTRMSIPQAWTAEPLTTSKVSKLQFIPLQTV